MPILILTCKKGIGYKTPYKNRAFILKNYLVLFGSYIISHFSPYVNPEPPKNSKFTLKNALQYGIIKASEGGDCMAERGSNDKSNKTLRAYLVYDYILKKTTSDTFRIGKLNAYLEAYGIKCDNRAIMRDIEAINQAFIMLENELSDAEEANELLQKQENQLVMRYDNWGGYRINREHFKRMDIALIAECIGAARFIDTDDTERLIGIVTRALDSKITAQIQNAALSIQREKIHDSVAYKNLNRIFLTINYNEEYHYWDELRFDYLTYDVETLGKSKPEYTKEEHIVFPHKVINCNGLYYLFAYDTKKRSMRFFRIDRMSDVDEYYNESETRHGIRTAEKMDYATLTTRTFDMHMGESTRVSMRFSNRAFDEVFERFGADGVSYHKCDDGHFEVSLVLDVSDRFFGWLCGFGKDAKLVSPLAVVEQFVSYLDEIKSQY